jgi:ubiquinone/menaquinone biosynthesis C-methylase UbiE
VCNPVSESVTKVSRRYDRLAPLYRAMLPLFLPPRGARPAAVEALDLAAGASVLEVGCGSGGNLPLLVDAVGPSGRVYGVDISTGMLGRAKRLIDRQRWSNVELREEDAARLSGPDQLDGVLFGLSYAVLPEPRTALKAGWQLLRPGGRLVIVEGGLPDNLLGRLLRPPVLALSRLTVLGDPDVRGWVDLGELSPDVQTRWLQFGTYYVSRAVKS